MKDVDISKFKDLLEGALTRRSADLELSDEEKLKNLVEKYPIAVTSDGTLYQYSYLLSEPISEEIKKLSIFEASDTEENNDSELDAKKNVNSGIWFSAKIFLTLQRQLYLESKLINHTKSISAQIAFWLWTHTGNGRYYEFDETTIIKLFEYAIDLYIVNSHKHSDFAVENEFKPLISAVKHFVLNSSIDYEIKNGTLILDINANTRIHDCIERSVKKIGGRRLLEIIFKVMLEPIYNSELDRYLINRNKPSMGYEQNATPIPYQYLIQLALKHLKINGNAVLAQSPIINIEQLFLDLLKNSRAYVDLLQIYNPSVMSDTMINLEDIPKYISDNMLFETLCIPSQYSPRFVVMVIENLYLSKIANSNGYPDFYKSKYLPCLIEETLDCEPCSIITVDFLHRRTNAKKVLIKEFLLHFSQKENEVNREFNGFLGNTNTKDYPLIQLSEEDFFLASPHFSGYAFAERIYKNIKSGYNGNYDRDLGNTLEELIKRLLDNKKFSYKCGTYAVGNDAEQAECDLVLETNKSILLVEIKKRPLPETFENGDDVETLKSLGEGMLSAQKQLFKHRLYLKKYGQINFDDSTTIVKADRMVHSISICLPEYNFFTTKMLAQRLTESLVFVSYSTYDETKTSRLDKLNSIAEEFKVLVGQYADGEIIDSNQLFFNVSFKSLQQFWVALNNSKAIEDFVENLTCDAYIILSSLDYYSNLKWHLEINKS